MISAHTAVKFRDDTVSEPAQLGPIAVTASPEQKFHEYLEIRGEKLTAPRLVLVRHIFDSHKHFDADELVADLHGSGRKVSRSTVYRMVAEHTFPAPVKLAKRAVGWRHDDVRQWTTGRPNTAR